MGGERKGTKVLVVYYLMYGHIRRMADAIAEGVREVPGVEADLRRVPETLSEQMLQAMGAAEAQKAMAGGKGERTPSENELSGARFQGRHVAALAKKLAG